MFERFESDDFLKNWIWRADFLLIRADFLLIRADFLLIRADFLLPSKRLSFQLYSRIQLKMSTTVFRECYLVNQFPQSGYFFVQTSSPIFLNFGGLTFTNPVNDPRFDASFPSALFHATLIATPTFFFPVAVDESILFRSTFETETLIWFAASESTPDPNTPTERTLIRISPSLTLHQIVISAEYGVSAGIDVFLDSASSPSLASHPTNPIPLYANVLVTSTPAFSRVPNLRYYANSLAKRSVAGVAFEETACGIHRSRVFWKRDEDQLQSFSRWLRATGGAAYTWKYDDWQCLDATCGYRPFGIGAPDQLFNEGIGFSTISEGPGIDGCVVPRPVENGGVELFDKMQYSCGFNVSLPKPNNVWINQARSGSILNPPDLTDLSPSGWWKPVGTAGDAIGIGCSIRVTPSTFSDSVTIVFHNLGWLTGFESVAVPGVLPVIIPKNYDGEASPPPPLSSPLPALPSPPPQPLPIEQFYEKQTRKLTSGTIALVFLVLVAFAFLLFWIIPKLFVEKEPLSDLEKLEKYQKVGYVR